MVVLSSDSMLLFRPLEKVIFIRKICLWMGLNRKAHSCCLYIRKQTRLFKWFHHPCHVFLRWHGCWGIHPLEGSAESRVWRWRRRLWKCSGCCLIPTGKFLTSLKSLSSKCLAIFSQISSSCLTIISLELWLHCPQRFLVALLCSVNIHNHKFTAVLLCLLLLHFDLCSRVCNICINFLFFLSLVLEYRSLASRPTSLSPSARSWTIPASTPSSSAPTRAPTWVRSGLRNHQYACEHLVFWFIMFSGSFRKNGEGRKRLKKLVTIVMITPDGPERPWQVYLVRNER